MRTGFVITARLKSTRLPEKVLLDMQGKPTLNRMIDRLKLATDVDEIIVATSTNPGDDRLVDVATDNGVSCFRGSEDDVVLRLYEAARSHQLDYMINITADCPMVAYDYVPEILRVYRRTDADLITCFKLPHGLYVYGIKPGAVAKVIEIKDQSNTEVWGTYFTDTGLFRVQELDIPARHQREYRLTLDYPEDYEFFKQLYVGLGQNAEQASTDEVVEFLDAHPEIVAINQACEARYEARWEKQKQLMKTR